MPIGPKGPPRKPGLSLRGRVFFDTLRGVPRARVWPPSRPTKPGSRREWTAKTFGAANRACKIFAAPLYGTNWEATRGTPLLPRDLMIAFMYGRAIALQLEDGTQVHSMAARADVSKSLDTLSNQPGSVLVRGPKYWEARQGSGSTYRRATIYRATTSGSVNLSGNAPIPFDGVFDDVGDFTDLAAHPTRLTIPAGVNLVRLTGTVVWINQGGSPWGLLQMGKNGVPSGVGLPEMVSYKPGSSVLANGTSGPIPCSEGDYFELFGQAPGDGAVNLLADRTWFSIEVLEA